MSLNETRIVTGSVEYLEHVIESVDAITGEAGETLVGTTVRFSMPAEGSAPSSWLAAGWVGTPTTTGLARTSAVVTFSTAGKYVLHIEITRGSEVAIRQCRKLTVSP